MLIPDDYVHRVYAGVLGKLIGVYLGRPFEGWSHQRIMAELGEINYYVNEKLKVPLVVSDDDITGTFTFIRALEDYGINADLTSEQIGQTWLNYIVENRTILWWGGMGMSTEHTAYLRLKSGIPAPVSGAIRTNGRVVAEQIGSQIFIDGWAMVSPGDPDLAVQLAKKAANVSHDGEAIYAAVVIAAMESMAFTESDLNILIDRAVSYIPCDSTIFRLITDLRACRADHDDWHQGLALIHDKYSYAQFGGNCHVVPNHAVIFLGLLWGNDDFQRSLMITNTAGYDTDCNSANVGCLLGIKNGLAGIDNGPDWRGPIADRLLLPTADGGRCISDAVSETYRLVRIGRMLAGQTSQPPKNGARFHFELPGSTQGFVSEQSPETSGTVILENVLGHSESGLRSLAVRLHGLIPGRVARVATQTFISVEQTKVGGYTILASPTIYAGQVVSAGVFADEGNFIAISTALYLRHYDHNNQLVRVYGPRVDLQPSCRHQFCWVVPTTDGQPIGEIGLEFSSPIACQVSVYVDFMTWQGTPSIVLKQPTAGGTMWTCAWVDGMQQRIAWLPESWVQNSGRGLLVQGSREWTDYHVETDITAHLVKSAGLAARVQGMERFYAVLLCSDHTVKLVKALDGQTILGLKSFHWEFGQTFKLALEVKQNQITAWIGGQLVFRVIDSDRPLLEGAVAIVCEEGRGQNGPVSIRPIV